MKAFLILGTFSVFNFSDPTRDLDSPRYATREYTRQILAAMGEWSLPRLRRHLHRGSVEVRTSARILVAEYCLPRIKPPKDYPSCWNLGYPLGKCVFLPLGFRKTAMKLIQGYFWNRCYLRQSGSPWLGESDYTEHLARRAVLLGVPYKWVRKWIIWSYDSPHFVTVDYSRG